MKEDIYNCKGMPIMMIMQRIYGTASLGKRLATLRWSLRTQILVIIAPTAVIWDCRDMREQLPRRLELPQLTKASGERPQEVTLRVDCLTGKRTCLSYLRTLTVRGLGPDCSRCRFFSLN